MDENGDEDNFEATVVKYLFKLNGEIPAEIQKNPLIVAPYALKTAIKSFGTVETVARVSVGISDDTKIQQPNEEYLEDEQLYFATPQDESFQPFDFTVTSINKKAVNIIVLPNLSNSHPMLYNKLSEYVLEILTPKEVILLSPCSLNYSETLCKLSNFEDQLEISHLRPPHFVSGIPAAFMAGAIFKHLNAISLLLDSEGAVNFERINEDSIREAIKLIINRFQLPSATVKSFKKSSDNFGMYI